ncbi:hypothetical protein [Actinomadura oligospora]|uniref:hypothetical protein n=1 Tax=Actinomadura oligospora TaxID=111804 RepID=UPI00047D250C|nr:hypothetical protein [Actinomadura oligospora]
MTTVQRWEAARRRAVARAFSEVPYYREQWAAAGRRLDEPAPAASAGLADQLFRLCPLGSPFRPTREPSLWLAETATLRAALAVAAPSRLPVIEAGPSMLDRRTLDRGRPYAVILPPGADVVDESRRRALNERAVGLAAGSGAVVVGARDELDAVLPEIIAPSLITVVRASAAEAITTSGPVVAHDPALGYLAARHPACGALHLLWRHHHARVVDGVLQVTSLRRRRPTLCSVVPHDSGGVTVDRCHAHDTPTLA